VIETSITYSFFYRTVCVVTAIPMFFSGCGTVTPKVEFKEGAEIKGTSRFELNVEGVSRQPSGMIENVQVLPGAVHRDYKVERWRKSWDVVERRRYLSVAGVHSSEYSVGSDILDLIRSPLLIIFGPLLLPVSDDWQGGVSQILSGVLSLLPFICHNGRGVNETVIKNEKRVQVEPVPKREPSSPQNLDGLRMDWVLSYPGGGGTREKGRIRWPEPISLSWVDMVIKEPEVSEWNLAWSSQEMNIKGKLS